MVGIMLTLIASPFWWTFTLLNLAVHVGGLSLSFIARGRHSLWLMRQFGWTQLMAAGVRLTIRGTENLPREGGVLLAANHKSYFDIYALLAASHRPLRWVLKESLIGYPILGTFLRQSRAIGLDRENPGKAARVLVGASRDLRDGDVFVVFPEGTRIPAQGLGEFKGGVFQLSIKTGCPVVPVAIRGSGRVLPAKKLTVFPFRPIEIEYLEPVDPKPFGKDREAFIEEVRARISARLLDGDESDINNEETGEEDSR